MPSGEEIFDWNNFYPFRFGESLERHAALTQSGPHIAMHSRGSSSLGPLFIFVNDGTLESIKTREPVVALRGEVLREFARHTNASDCWLELRQLSAGPVKGEFTYGDPRFFLLYPNGAKVPDTAFSYGQRRFLSFLVSIAFQPKLPFRITDPVIADELVNGLHYDWIRICMDRLQGRQTFLTSQNPLLLDFLSFDSSERVRDTFVLCRLDEAGLMSWGRMSDDDAHDFYESYKQGYQQVGELARAKGLW